MSMGSIKAADKRFSNLPGDFEIALGPVSVIQECEDVHNVPEIIYNFISIAQISDMPPNSFVGKLTWHLFLFFFLSYVFFLQTLLVFVVVLVIYKPLFPKPLKNN